MKMNRRRFFSFLSAAPLGLPLAASALPSSAVVLDESVIDAVAAKMNEEIKDRAFTRLVHIAHHRRWLDYHKHALGLIGEECESRVERDAETFSRLTQEYLDRSKPHNDEIERHAARVEQLEREPFGFKWERK